MTTKARNRSGIVASVLCVAFKGDESRATMSHESNTHTGLRERRTRIHWLALAVLMVGSILVRVWLNRKIEAPTILTDELTYSQLAENIANGNFSLSSGYGFVYPLLLAPAWALADFGTTAYVYMQTTNAIVVSLVAIPVFLWAKRMMRPWYALLAAALTLAMPSMAYSGMIMTDNAFLTVFVLACFAVAVAAERPKVLNQAFVVAALLLAMGTRAQAVVLFAALPIIFLLTIVMEERATNSFSLAGLGRRALRFWPLATLAGIGLVVVVARTALTSWKLSDVLQAYGAVTTGQYDAMTVARYAVWHAGDAALAVGVIPIAAALVMVGLAILNRSQSAAERAYLSTALVASVLVIIQVAMFTSWFSQRVSERNMYCIFPLIFIGMALWLSRALPRPRRVAGVAGAIAGGLVFVIPFGYLYQRAPSTETWAIVLPDFLTRHLKGGSDDVAILIAVGVAIALLVFGIVKPRLALYLAPVLLIAYFVVSQTVILHTLHKVSADYRNAPSLGADADWLDRALPDGGDVLFFTGSSLGASTDQVILWETGFFNKNQFTAAPWGTNIKFDAATGALTQADGSPIVLPKYVITPAAVQLVGRVVSDRGAFILQEPTKPYRLKQSSQGVFADGWTGPSATIDVYAGTSSPLRVSVRRNFPGAPEIPADVTLRIGRLSVAEDGTASMLTPITQTVNVSNNGKVVLLDFPIPQTPFRIEITASPIFTPAEVGLTDPRQLGAQVSITAGGDQLVR